MVDIDDTQRTIHDGRRTIPGVRHKLFTGDLKNGWVIPQKTTYLIYKNIEKLNSC